MASACSDFRQFVKELQEEGDIQEINEEVDPHLEVGAIIRRACELQAPAPLFNNVRGRQENGLYRMLGGPVSLSDLQAPYRRLAKSVGLPSTASAKDLVDHLIEAESKPPIEPVVLPTGPVKTHILTGDDIDLEALPAPLLHKDDGGKFIQTLGMFVVQSPDGKWTNWSISRAMVHGKRTLVTVVMPRQDLGTIYQLWKDIGQEMPYALVFGVPPAALMASGMPLPKWTNENGYIGALTGHGVEVTKCTTNDLLVPAHAEIVFEGRASITETAPEGPMGEYHGLVFPGASRPEPVFHVDAITYRDDPILPVCVAGRAPDETHTLWGLAQSVALLAVCRKAGLPIRTAWCPLAAQSGWFVLQVDRPQLLALRTTRDAFCRRLAEVVFTDKKVGWYIPKLLLVSEDVDPSSLADVVWAESVFCEPGEGAGTAEFFFRGPDTIGLMPYVSHGGAAAQGRPVAKVLRCCMLPQEFTDEKLPWVQASFKHSYPPEVQEKVLRNWEKYGYKK